MRSVHAIQRAMVRMLFDPAFVEAVHRGPVPALTEPERALLVAVDRRAWGTDRYRRSRSVHALIEEFPATAAVLGVAEVDAWFSTEAFARTLASRGSLALDFGRWAEAQAGELAVLERAIALARRAERPVGSGLVTRPGVEPATLGAGTLQAYARIREALGPDPIEALAAGLEPVQPPEPGPAEALLIERAPDGAIAISGATEALVALLTYTTTPRERAAVELHAGSLGCDPDEARELVDELSAEPDPLLVPAR